MKRFLPVGLPAFFFFAALTSPAAAEETYLNATFDDKTVDEAIGMGGWSVGEPAWMHAGLSATIRATPFGTPCLELKNAAPGSTQWISFEPPSVSAGLFVVIMDVWFYRVSEHDRFYFRLYSSNWSFMFLEIRVDQDGFLHCYNPETTFGNFGPYPVGRSYPMMIALDLDAGTCSMWLDGVPVMEGAPHEIPLGTPVQRVQWAVSSSALPDTRMAIDQIRVLGTLPPAPLEMSSWGSVRALYRNR